VQGFFSKQGFYLMYNRKLSISDIHAIIESVDLVEIIGQRIPIKKAGNDFVASCPFHDEKTPSFRVNSKHQYYHCFGCGASGDALSFIIHYDNRSFWDAIKQLSPNSFLQGGPSPSPVRPRRVIPVESPIQPITPEVSNEQDKARDYYARQLFSPKGEEALSYLNSRGINEDTIRKFGLGYGPFGRASFPFAFTEDAAIRTGIGVRLQDGQVKSLFSRRILFPITNEHGQIAGWGGRYQGKETCAKYINSPETDFFKKKQLLYGLSQVIEKNKKPDEILVVEGYMDVLMLHQFGFENAVAVLGTATTNWHLDALFRHTSRVVLCFDGDAAGEKALQKAIDVAAPYIQEGRDVAFLVLPAGHDPDSFLRDEGADAFRAKIQRAISAQEYLKNPSIVRRAVTLLVHHPELIDRLDETSESLLMAHHKVGNFIQWLVPILRRNPNIEPGYLEQQARSNERIRSQLDYFMARPFSIREKTMEESFGNALEKLCHYFDAKPQIDDDSFNFVQCR
jgi:DNA primase